MDSSHTSLELPQTELPAYQSASTTAPYSQRYTLSIPVADSVAKFAADSAAAPLDAAAANAASSAVSEAKPAVNPEVLTVGWEDPAFSQRLLRNLEDFSGAFRESVTEQSKLKSELHYTGQQMSQVFGAMSQLLDIMYERMLGPSALQPAPKPAPTDPSAHPLAIDSSAILTATLQPLTQGLCESIDQGFGEVNRRVHMSEERHLSALEATLQQLQTEREIQNTSFQTQIAGIQLQTRLECNRLIQVLLMGTMVAAAGAAMAFFLLRH